MFEFDTKLALDAQAHSNEQGVIVELRLSPEDGYDSISALSLIDLGEFSVDSTYKPVPMRGIGVDSQKTLAVRGTIEKEKIEELRLRPHVVEVYLDIEVFPTGCPIPPCDCDNTVAKGSLTDVRQLLQIQRLWDDGFKGENITVGIVDGGITADGRPLRPGENPRHRIPQVTGGWPDDWGTTASNWLEHGNMTASGVLGMAPGARIYDIRISGGTRLLSNALAGYEWALQTFLNSGKPQILSNSWAIRQSSIDPVYATDPNHIFTRKVVEVIHSGMLVLFSAGNCGATCPQGCGDDTGPCKSIWGANAHPAVMTIVAVNPIQQYVGYCSCGPSIMDPHKPDFCAVTHYKNYFADCDFGTSAACAIAAGAAALLKQAHPNIDQPGMKNLIMSTAKEIGTPGWDQYAGAGLMQVGAAHAFVLNVHEDTDTTAPRQ